MADNKTEQPTPRRRSKAREQGQLARSRELSSAVAVMGTLLLLRWRSVGWAEDWRATMSAWLDAANSSSLNCISLSLWTAVHVLRWMVPLWLVAWTLAAATSFAQGGLNWAPAALAPKLERLSPASRIQQLFSVTAIAGLLRSLIPTGIILYLSVGALSREWNRIRWASFESGYGITTSLFELLFEIAWKSGLVMLIWSAADYLLVRYQVESGLKMSKEELRQEHKETEGDPQVKGRIRRLQRQVRRRKMLQDVAKAAVVVTNPTHYAIALVYNENTPAPMVAAKGRDRLAELIKEAARWHEVPMVENPPLAHALYRAVQVGQSIPSKLYVAVAEVLAYVFRMQAETRRARLERKP